MKPKGPRRYLPWILPLLVGVCLPVAAQTSDQALVREVKSLREALERNAAITTRTQITLQKLVMQHQRVERIMRDLFDVRRQMDVATADREKALATIRTWEGKIAELGAAMGMGVRGVWEDTITKARPDLERATAEMQGCQARHAELSNSLRTEEAKLAVLTNQLEEIERSLPPWK